MGYDKLWDTAESKSRNESADWTAALFECTKFTDYVMLSRNISQLYKGFLAFYQLYKTTNSHVSNSIDYHLMYFVFINFKGILAIVFVRTLQYFVKVIKQPRMTFQNSIFSVPVLFFPLYYCFLYILFHIIYYIFLYDILHTLRKLNQN